jgi:hypothetical protein
MLSKSEIGNRRAAVGDQTSTVKFSVLAATAQFSNPSQQARRRVREMKLGIGAGAFRTPCSGSLQGSNHFGIHLCRSSLT